MELVIELPVSQFEKLREIATQIGVLPEYTANRHNFMFLIPHPNPPPLGEGVYEKRRLCRFAVYLAKAAISDLISVGDEDFHSAADYVIRKNEELYRRLS
jgi:hypothetical protein